MLTVHGWTPQAAGEEPDPACALRGVSESGRHLLSRLLEVGDDRRISVEDALQHPWVDEVRLTCMHACFLHACNVAPVSILCLQKKFACRKALGHYDQHARRQRQCIEVTAMKLHVAARTC